MQRFSLLSIPLPYACSFFYNSTFMTSFKVLPACMSLSSIFYTIGVVCSFFFFFGHFLKMHRRGRGGGNMKIQNTIHGAYDMRAERILGYYADRRTSHLTYLGCTLKNHVFRSERKRFDITGSHSAHQSGFLGPWLPQFQLSVNFL